MRKRREGQVVAEKRQFFEPLDQIVGGEGRAAGDQVLPRSQDLPG